MTVPWVPEMTRNFKTHKKSAVLFWLRIFNSSVKYFGQNVSLDIFVQDLKLGCEVLDTSSISFACVCLFNKLDQRGMSNVNIKIFVPN